MMNSKDSDKMRPVSPFAEQTQQVSDVESTMEPIPDHGEDTYVGHSRLIDRIALITGGDSGIGKAVAIAMAREGADVVIVYKDDIQDDHALSTLTWIQKANRKGLLLKGDIRNEAYCQQVIERTIETFGRIDVIVNNAAYQMSYESLEDIYSDEWSKTVETNLSTMFYLVKYGLKHLLAGSSIINTTSVNAHGPNPDLISYAASKAEIQNFTANLGRKFLAEGSGIRINAVVPGPVRTAFIASTIPEHESFGSKSPMVKPAQPVELAPIYVFLASDEASCISGATIPLTAGEITN